MSFSERSYLTDSTNPVNLTLVEITPVVNFINFSHSLVISMETVIYVNVSRHDRV